MSEKKPVQIEPLIDPNQSVGDIGIPYYLLEPMHSPPIAPPNALSWTAYPQPMEFFRGDDPHDNRRAYGFITYDRHVSWQDLIKYNMLPFDYDESVLFDLWQSFKNDKVKLIKFFEDFFSAIAGDPGLRHVALAAKLVSRDWTLEKIKKAIEEIK